MLKKNFFKRKADIVAKELLGKILCRRIDGKVLKSKIVETEAYFGEDDPASRACKGKNKISEMMWESPGKILIYNVHKYKMLNFITGKEGEASAVLIRALEPLNFKARTSGPGLLTDSLKIEKTFHGESIFELKELFLENSNEEFEIIESSRIGVSKDLPVKLRFYIKDNNFISKK
ncbi:hypothetical protein DRN73_02435 [Candidatus Pacearchaeota archaeon]|nr:MAG: hypothetical protein DRN73_02435 [Candidatus Pacearchaeota archaeon]